MIIKNKAWVYYHTEASKELLPSKCGKWMYFFKREAVDFAAELCKRAIEEGIVSSCKHTNCEFDERPEGVICFYLNCDDKEAHKRVISYFLKNGLVRKTKTGRYVNIAFKLDDQTRAGEYGEGFVADIKLADFIDLTTGEWLVD